MRNMIIAALFGPLLCTSAYAQSLWLLKNENIKMFIEVQPKGTTVLVRNIGSEQFTYRKEDLQFELSNGTRVSPSAIAAESLFGIGSSAMVMKTDPGKTDIYYLYADPMGRVKFTVSSRLKAIHLKSVGDFRLSNPGELDKELR